MSHSGQAKAAWANPSWTTLCDVARFLTHKIGYWACINQGFLEIASVTW